MATMRVIFPGLLAACLAIGCGGDDSSGDGGDSPDAGGGASDAAVDEPDASTAQARNPALYEAGQPFEPDITAAELSSTIDNPRLPMPPGATWVIEATTDDGLERIEIEVLSETQAVWGTNARVVRDTAFLDGAMIEDTFDWYTQDEAGNVWYMGEATTEYDPDTGEPLGTAGSWEAGVDGAAPGVVMLADPQIGDRYRQEFYEGEAEDLGEVVSLSETVTVPAGTFEGCLKTRDTSVLDPELDEFKYYCAGVGNVLIEEGDVREELVEYTGLD